MVEWKSSIHQSKVEYHLAQTQDTYRSNFPLVSFPQGSGSEWMVGWISMDIDYSCPHHGSQLVESVEHIFFNCALAQQVWRDVANIIWQLFANKVTLALINLF